MSPQRETRSLGWQLGLALSLTVGGAALLSLFWTPWDTAQLSVVQRLRAPDTQHWLGTDQLGRDLLSMLMQGAASSLGVALVATLGGLALGLPLGLWAAARGGWVDELVMRASDVLFAFPSLLLAVLAATVLGPGERSAEVAIAVFNVPVFARVVRGGAQALWTRDFVLAARLAGKGPWHISLGHVLPNLAGLLWVQVSVQLSMGLLAEAALSYIGLGAQPPQPSWGRMLADAQTLTALAPQLAVLPGLAIVAAVMGFNLLGDGLRARFDPRRNLEAA